MSRSWLDLFVTVLGGAVARQQRQRRLEMLRGTEALVPPMQVIVSERGHALLWACVVSAYSTDFLFVEDMGLTFDEDGPTSSVPLRFRRADGWCVDREGWRLNDNELLAEVRERLRGPK